MAVFAVAVLALATINAMLVSVLVWRRVRLAQKARSRRRLEQRLRPLALAFVEREADLPSGLNLREQEVLADVLGGYARMLRGPSKSRIATYFVMNGTLARELHILGEARSAGRRASAAYRLGDIGSPAATTGLLAALGDESREVRTAATRSLGKLGAPEAVEPLLAAVAAQSVSAALIGWALLQIGPAALPRLRAALNDDEPMHRAGAVRMIGLLGDPADAEAITARLRDTSAQVRMVAARSLQRLGGARDVPALLDALEDRIPAVRAAAAEALGRLHPDRVDPLLVLAGGDDFDVSRAAAHAAACVDLEATSIAARSAGAVHLAEAVDLARLP